MKEVKAQVRLYCILAREAPLAVVFRRGPSKQVQLVLWHTDTDQFDEGQWLKRKRIYERRCDLSPNGKHLIYFTANFKQPYFSWTAISKPPFLTALALWPKGDCWGGGGLFKSEKEIHLNHRAAEMAVADGFKLPSKLKIKPLGQGSGWGEDNPIFDTRLRRDGWRMLQEGEAIQHGLGASVWVDFKPALVWSKPHAASRGRYELQMHIHGMHERDGPWYVVEHLVKDKNGSTTELGRTEWADWCHSGDLLFAQGGKLYRLGFSEAGVLNELSSARLLIDLSDRTFKPVAPPIEATQWE